MIATIADQRDATDVEATDVMGSSSIVRPAPRRAPAREDGRAIIPGCDRQIELAPGLMRLSHMWQRFGFRKRPTTMQAARLAGTRGRQFAMAPWCRFGDNGLE